MKRKLPPPLLLALLTLTSPAFAQGAAAPSLLPKSVVPSATANGDSAVAAVSGNGRFLVLASSAADLTPGAADARFAQLYFYDAANKQRWLITANLAGAASGGNAAAPTVSEDGGWVVFESEAADLVAGDTNAASDVFLHDVTGGTTLLVSREVTGASSARGRSTAPVMTPDGAWLAFASDATDLVSGITDVNQTTDVFLHDKATGQTRLASKHYRLNETGRNPAWDPLLSPDGQRLVFFSANTGLADGTPMAGIDTKLYLHNITANTNRWASRGAAEFPIPVVPNRLKPWKALFSGDGRFLIYAYGPLVLRYDPAADATTLVATNLAEAGLPLFGSQPIASSADGSLIAFAGSRSNVLQSAKPPDAIFLWRESDQTVTRLEVPVAEPGAVGQVGGPAVSRDGRYVAYQAQIIGPTTGLSGPGLYLFRHDLETSAAQVVTVFDTLPTEGIPGLWNPLWNDDLTQLGFTSDSPGLVPDDNNHARDAFLLHLDPMELSLLSARDSAVPSLAASGPSWVRPHAISADGRFIVFSSAADDLVTGDANGVGDVFLHDLGSRSNSLVSLNLSGTGPGNGYSHSPVISADGKFVAFASLASDLVAEDTNGLNDVFLRDLQAGTTMLVSRAFDGAGSASGSSLNPAISADGGIIAFESQATNVVSPDLADLNKHIKDVFVFDRLTQSNQLVSIRPDNTRTADLGGFGPVLTPDGRRVVFLSRATDLVSPAPAVPGGGAPLAYIRELATHQTTLVTADDGSSLAVSPSERRPVVVSGDSSTFAISRGPPSGLGIVVRRFSGEWAGRVALALNPALSHDGEKLVYVGRSNPTGPKPPQVYLMSLPDHSSNVVSVNLTGNEPGNGWAYQPVVSGDARYVVFKSTATDLVANDTNAFGDIFVRDVVAGQTLLVSANTRGATANHASISPVMGPDGRTVVFMSWASDLVGGDLNRASDLFVLRLGSGPVADSDEDGLPDDWEMAFFNSLERDGAADFDEDGLTDSAEYKAGTDPTGRGSVLRVLTLTSAGGSGVTVLWSAVAGKRYRVQFNDRVNDAAWTDLPGDVRADSESALKTDSTAGASLLRFYRAALVE